MLTPPSSAEDEVRWGLGQRDSRVFFPICLMIFKLPLTLLKLFFVIVNGNMFV